MATPRPISTRGIITVAALGVRNEGNIARASAAKRLDKELVNHHRPSPGLTVK